MAHQPTHPRIHEWRRAYMGRDDEWTSAILAITDDLLAEMSRPPNK